MLGDILQNVIHPLWDREISWLFRDHQGSSCHPLCSFGIGYKCRSAHLPFVHGFFVCTWQALFHLFLSHSYTPCQAPLLWNMGILLSLTLIRLPLLRCCPFLGSSFVSDRFSNRNIERWKEEAERRAGAERGSVVGRAGWLSALPHRFVQPWYSRV